MNTHDTSPSSHDIDLIAEALRKSGKTQEEIDTVTTVDRAQTNADEGRMRPGAIQIALLSRRLPLRLFACQSDQSELHNSTAAAILKASIEQASKHMQAGTLLDTEGKVAQAVISDLAQAGYWGLPVPKKWGGASASKFFLGRAITAMGSECAEILGGLLSIERLIGAAGPLILRGSDAQRTEFLVPLAQGVLRSGFAGTEPHVGCNITKVKTYGVIDGDDVVVFGEKLFISNAWYGHVVALFLAIDDKLRVLITKLPDNDSAEFRIVNYGIHALRQIHNKGLVFNGLRVPKRNLLEGDGLSIIFHDLDDGRFAVAATAACRMRKILSSCIPWVKFRETFGKPLAEREYIRYLLALQAAYIAGADCLVDWSASLIDAGYQADVSSMIAKTKATDWLRRCSTELGMFTHGGRFVLQGHTIGDNLADDLVSSVYEGPNPMLGKACVKALAKAFGEDLLKPLMKVLAQSDVDLKKVNLSSVGATVKTLRYVWTRRSKLKANRSEISAKFMDLVGFIASSETQTLNDSTFVGLDDRFSEHLQFANRAWFKWRKNFVRTLLVNQERLADEDIIMLEGLYEPLTNIVAMLCAIAASRQAAWSKDQPTLCALDLLCLELRCLLSSEVRTAKRYRLAVDVLAGHILNDDFRQIRSVHPGSILRPY